MPEFDTGFSALIEDMSERGLLDDTLVVCMGEFGRTPKINKDVGRDHWAPAASLLFAGAGVKPGFVLGATDKQGAYATRRPGCASGRRLHGVRRAGHRPAQDADGAGRPADRDSGQGRGGEGVVRVMRVLLRLTIFVLALPAALLLAQDKKKSPSKDQPQILLALPFGVKPGVAAKITLRGRKLENAKEVRVSPKGTARLLSKGAAGVPAQMDAGKVGTSQVTIELTIPADVPGDSVQVVVVGPGGESAPHAVLLDRTPVVVEKEPNDGFKQAQPVALGQIVQGAISRPSDVDTFRFEGKAGQRVVLEIHAARLGSALDSVLTLYDDTGATIDSCDDIVGSTDSRIEATLPRTGSYYLVVSDANDQGAEFFAYRLSLRMK